MLGFIWKAACLACNSSKSKLLYLEAAIRQHTAGEMLGADFLLYHPEYKKIGIRGSGLNNTNCFQCLIRGMLEWIFSPGASVQQCEDPRMLAEQASEVLWGWQGFVSSFLQVTTHHWGKPGQEHEAETTGTLLIRLLRLRLTQSPGLPAQGWMPPIMGHALLHHGTIRTVLHREAHRPVWSGQFLTPVSLFPSDSRLWQVDNKN